MAFRTDEGCFGCRISIERLETASGAKVNIPEIKLVF
jgi:hypothetical protein